MKDLFDLHSHILPNVDDGAKDIEESLKLLEMLKEQGVTCVLATPHFYPMQNSLEEYNDLVNSAFNLIKKETENKNLPQIYLGCEILYYIGISQVTSLSQFCLNNSNYLLLELPEKCINNNLFYDIKKIKENYNIEVIIAHIERYYKSRNFKKLLKFVKENNIPTQLNCSSLFSKPYIKISNKLLKNDYITFLSTDTHSTDLRPPMYKEALEYIELNFGKDKVENLLANSKRFYNEIILKE